MDSLLDTEKFMRAAGQTIPAVPTAPDVETRKLRLSLILEELYELAEAYGLRDTFDHMLVHKSGVDAEGFAFCNTDTGNYDAVAALDALADLRVVLDGAVLACGLKDVYPAALDEVSRSNMSKFFTAARPAINFAYAKCAAVHENNGVWSVKNEVGKVLKVPTYSPANLAPLLS